MHLEAALYYDLAHLMPSTYFDGPSLSYRQHQAFLAAQVSSGKMERITLWEPDTKFADTKADWRQPMYCYSANPEARRRWTWIFTHANEPDGFRAHKNLIFLINHPQSELRKALAIEEVGVDVIVLRTEYWLPGPPRPVITDPRLWLVKEGELCLRQVPRDGNEEWNILLSGADEEKGSGQQALERFIEIMEERKLTVVMTTHPHGDGFETGGHIIDSVDAENDPNDPLLMSKVCMQERYGVQEEPLFESKWLFDSVLRRPDSLDGTSFHPGALFANAFPGCVSRIIEAVGVFPIRRTTFTDRLTLEEHKEFGRAAARPLADLLAEAAVAATEKRERLGQTNVFLEVTSGLVGLFINSSGVMRRPRVGRCVARDH